jgi:hypothetical protein
MLSAISCALKLREMQSAPALTAHEVSRSCQSLRNIGPQLSTYLYKPTRPPEGNRTDLSGNTTLRAVKWPSCYQWTPCWNRSYTFGLFYRPLTPSSAGVHAFRVFSSVTSQPYFKLSLLTDIMSRSFMCKRLTPGVYS